MVKIQSEVFSSMHLFEATKYPYEPFCTFLFLNKERNLLCTVTRQSSGSKRTVLTGKKNPCNYTNYKPIFYLFAKMLIFFLKITFQPGQDDDSDSTCEETIIMQQRSATSKRTSLLPDKSATANALPPSAAASASNTIKQFKNSSKESVQTEGD